MSEFQLNLAESQKGLPWLGADRCKINFVRRGLVRAQQIKLMEQISPVIKIKIHVSYNLAER